MGVIQCAKMQFQAKIFKFYVKLAANLFNFSFFLYVKFIQKWKKGVTGCE